MKIESIGQIKEVEQIQIISEYALPKFAEGEILIAQIEHIQGDQVMLKNKDGQAFMALMQSDLGLSEGNIVELSANSNGAGYVLHLLDIEKSVSIPTLGLAADVIPDTLAAMKANPGIDPKAASFLIENNIPRTPENIAALARIVRGGSELGSLLAEILSALDDPDIQFRQMAATPGQGAAPQTVQTQAEPVINIVGKNTEQSDMTAPPTAVTGEEPAAGGAINVAAEQAAGLKGQAQAAEPAAQGSSAAGELPIQAYPQETAYASAAPDAAGTAYAPQQNPGEALSEAAGQPGMPADAAAVQTLAAAGVQPQNAADASTIAGQTQSIAQAQPQNLGDASVKQVSNEAQQVILNEDIYAMKGNTAGEQKTEAAAGGVPAQKEATVFKQPVLQDMPEVSKAINKEAVKERILDLFCRPDKQTGAEFKKTVTDMPDGLNSLKLLLHQSDNHDRGTAMQKADQAQKQTELLSESKRFDCIQIPFMMKNGAERTAELYVYRHKRSKKESGEAGMSVLVALDTQHIGRIETLMKTDGKNITLEFRLEHKEIQPEIIKRSKALAKAMENAGYTLKSLKITGLEMKTTVLNATGVLMPDAGVSPGNIDVQI